MDQQLSADILQVICSFLDAKCKYLLWASGSKRLMTLLEAASLISLDFNFVPTNGYKLYWPRFALYLPHLKELSISRCLQLARRPSLCDLAAKKLTKLRLDHSSAAGDFARAMAASPSMFDSLEHLFLYVNDSLPPVLPPNLLFLKLRNYEFDAGAIQLNKYIPKSVTALKMVIWVDSYVGEFNQDLQELTVLVDSFAGAKLPALPSSLTKLTMRERYPSMKMTNCEDTPDVSHLKSLTKLCVVQGKDWTPERYLSLPAGLKHFEFSSNSMDAALHTPSSLPPSLTSFSDHGARMTKDSKLPNLQSLSAHRINDDYATFFSHSTTLLELVLFDRSLTVAEIKVLPRTVTSLSIPQLTDEMIPSLPPRLLRLSASVPSIDCKSWPLLPQSLLALSTMHLKPATKDFFVQLLPPRLEEFSNVINSAPTLAHQNYWQLPFTIRVLSMPFSKLMPVEAFQDWNLQLPHLVRLTIEAYGSPVDPLFLSYLPRSVTFLIVTRSPELGNEHIKALPPSLTFFCFRRSTVVDGDILVDDAGMAMLPRSLRSLYLPAAPHVTEQCSAHLPPFLSTFQLDATMPDWFTAWLQEQRAL